MRREFEKSPVCTYDLHHECLGKFIVWNKMMKREVGFDCLCGCHA